MICQKCKDEGLTSRVYIGMSTRTLMGKPPDYYDEQGKLVVAKDPNRTTTEYSCSNGHKWIEVS